MSKKGYFAVVNSPSGLWESTASVSFAKDPDVAKAEAFRWAREKFVELALPDFMRKTVRSHLVASYWDCAVEAGCEMVLEKIEIDK